MLLAVTVVLLLHNRQALRRVNYSLLLTFVFFFILIGNLGNMSEIRSAILSVLQGHELLVSVLASQVVSNVPAAILLSGFTPEGELLVVTAVAECTEEIGLERPGQSLQPEEGRAEGAVS